MREVSLQKYFIVVLRGWRNPRGQCSNPASELFPVFGQKGSGREVRETQKERVRYVHCQDNPIPSQEWSQKSGPSALLSPLPPESEQGCPLTKPNQKVKDKEL